METLFALLLAGLVALVVCAICYAAVLVDLYVTESWPKALLALVCPPYVFAWGWRHRGASIWMTAWTCAVVFLVTGITLAQVSMG
jgi:hypothetical protein